MRTRSTNERGERDRRNAAWSHGGPGRSHARHRDRALPNPRANAVAVDREVVRDVLRGMVLVAITPARREPPQIARECRAPRSPTALVLAGRARDEIEAQRVEQVGALEEVAVPGAGDQLELGAPDA